MTTPESNTPPQTLHEVAYPNDLRADRAAVTYVDEQGFTYLAPKAFHDFEASQRLIHAGLSTATIVEIGDYGDLVQYKPDTDLLPLPALLNSSIGSEEMAGDITTAFELIGEFFKDAEKSSDFSPAVVTRNMFAINRGTGRAELLAPFLAADHVATVAVSMEQLKADILQSTRSEADAERIERCFAAAMERIER